MPGSEAPVWQVGPGDLLAQSPSEPAGHCKIARETVRGRSSAESAVAGVDVCGQRRPLPGVVSRWLVGGESLGCAGQSSGIEGAPPGASSAGDDKPRGLQGMSLISGRSRKLLKAPAALAARRPRHRVVKPPHAAGRARPAGSPHRARLFPCASLGESAGLEVTCPLRCRGGFCAWQL